MEFFKVKSKRECLKLGQTTYKNSEKYCGNIITGRQSGDRIEGPLLNPYVWNKDCLEEIDPKGVRCGQIIVNKEERKICGNKIKNQ